ncbi:MAG: 1,4-dihydroxy-6-naphthoate synthase, partial [Thermoleophilia bacterium]|nr:1,4-dihydroxy-6-naphthoate synthase [Thermoleophilia bacterium]
MRDLTFGFSPCPNDTFAFHALVAGLIDEPVRVQPRMADIETLNQLAHAGELELTKLSFGALAALEGEYVPLRSGAALGRGVGPLVVAREPMELGRAAAGPIAIPGRDTTAYLLLGLAAGDDLGDVVEMRYDKILQAVEQGDVEAGLIIHESRFTYADHGLVKVCDLGEWWEQYSGGMPVPLAAICTRRDVDDETRAIVERALRASVEHAFAHPEASAQFVQTHAQEMSPAVQRQHIDLYVNDYTIDLGDDGLAAVDALLKAARTPAPR